MNHTAYYTHCSKFIFWKLQETPGSPVAADLDHFLMQEM